MLLTSASQQHAFVNCLPREHHAFPNNTFTVHVPTAHPRPPHGRLGTSERLSPFRLSSFHLTALTRLHRTPTTTPHLQQNQERKRTITQPQQAPPQAASRRHRHRHPCSRSGPAWLALEQQLVTPGSVVRLVAVESAVSGSLPLAVTRVYLCLSSCWFFWWILLHLNPLLRICDSHPTHPPTKEVVCVSFFSLLFFFFFIYFFTSRLRNPPDGIQLLGRFL